MRTAYYYFLYLLLICGIIGKIVTWFIFPMKTEFSYLADALLLAYFVLDIKTIYQRLNPGVRITSRIQRDDFLEAIPVVGGWRIVGIVIRLFGVVLSGILAFGLIQSFPPQYGLATLAGLAGGMLLIGAVRYAMQSPYYILVSEDGVQSYMFNYRKFDWEEVRHINERANFVEVKLIDRSDQDFEFENIALSGEELTGALRTRAILNNFRYFDNSDEYTRDHSAYPDRLI